MPQSFDEVVSSLERDLLFLEQQGSVDLPTALANLSSLADAHLNQIVSDFGTGTQRLSSSLDAADLWLSTALASLQPAVVAVLNDQSQLDANCQQWLKDLQQLTSHFQSDLQAVDASLAALDQQLTGDHQAIQTEVSALVGTVQAAVVNLNQAYQQLLLQFGAVDTQWLQDLQGTASALHGLMGAMDSEYGAIHTALTSQTDDTVQRAQQLLDATARQLESGSSQVSQALALFGEEGRRVSDVLDGSVGKVLDAIREVRRVLEQIRPFLDAIDQLT